jgi:hypothetical protein
LLEIKSSFGDSILGLEMISRKFPPVIVGCRRIRFVAV